MVSPDAINEYMDKNLENYNWIKDLPKAVLMDKLYEVWPDYDWKTYNPFRHQIAMLLLGLMNPNFLFFSTMGTGKTRVAIDLVRYYQKKALVVCFNVASIDTWKTEIDIHSDLSCIELYGTKEERIAKLQEDKDIYIINYTGLQVLLADLVNHSREINYKAIAEFKKKFGMIILDESHLCKSRESLTYRLCRELTKNITNRYALTGTPMGRDPQDLWSQFYLIDRGETLGSSIGIFRAAFFKEEENYWGGNIYKFNHRLEGRLNSRIANKSITYVESEVNDLPELMQIPHMIHLPKDINEYYATLVSGISNKLITKEDIRDMENAFIRMRQLCSGFIDFENEDGDRTKINFSSNPKLEALEDIINSVPPNKKVVIFNEFTYSGELICKLLKQMKIKYTRLYGETKDKSGAVQKFLTDPNYRVFVVNSKSGGMSLNLQVANYVVYYELPISNIIYSQSIKRVHRTGQTDRVYAYYLLIKGSIEEKIMGYLQKGEDIFTAIIQGREKLD
jgi:SNF2 family DNA or RNA helicase